MKLGTETASLVNHLYSRSTIGQPEPAIGMGATILNWTDRNAATVVDVMPNRGTVIVMVRTDNVKRTDTNGMSECQKYEYSYDPNGATDQFRRTKTGAWEAVRYNSDTGRFVKTGGAGLIIGRREEYRDFSF